MAKHPDWSIVEPGTRHVRYWTSQATSSNPSAGFWTETNTVPVPNHIKDSGVRSYAVTPGFNSPSNGGRIPPLSYSATYQKKSASSDSHSTEMRSIAVSIPGGGSYQAPYVYQDSTQESKNIYALGFIPNRIDSTAIAACQRKATNKLLENLKDSKVNLAQAFAEREQTCKTVTSAMKTVASALTNLKKGNFSGAAKAFGVKPPKRGQRRFNKEFANDATNAVTNGWLALQYGWKPLLQDVYGAAETLAQASLGPTNRNSIYSVVSGRSSRIYEENTREVGVIPANWSGYYSTTRTYKGKLSVQIGVTYTRSSPPTASLAKLGILNPALLAWELTPYSFVVDWFFPIGTWLGNLDATAGMQFFSGFQTTFYKYDQSAVMVDTEFRKDGLASYVASGNENSSTAVMSRVTLTGFPSAPFPRLKNPLSYSHLMSAFSLLKQFKR